MKKRIFSTLFFVISVLVVIILARDCRGSRDAVNPDDRPTLYVSIYPLKYLIDEISGHKFDVRVLVPTGASPETYEPTPRQIKELNDAPLIFTTGLIDFERELVGRLTANSRHIMTVVDLSEGVELLEGHCGHDGHSHSHGIDPHIWSSPRRLAVMAGTVCGSLALLSPVDSSPFAANLRTLLAKIDSLDRWIGERIASMPENGRGFVIYHPALTYYAADYGLTQTAIEQEGKEPSAEQLKELIKQARAQGIKTVLYQKEFSASVVETVAADIGARAVEIDPLAEDIPANLRRITEHITGR